MEQATDRKIITELRGAWNVLQRLAPDLPEITIVFRDTSIDLTQDQTVYVSGETLSMGAEVTFAALAHDAAHLLAETRDIADTSRRGQYHNQHFATLAGELGFETQYNDVTGSAGVRLAPNAHRQALNRLAKVLPASGDPLTAPLPKCRTRRVRRPGRGGVKASCLCWPPRSFRVAPGVLAQGGILCIHCGAHFEIRETAAV
jgi:hypothetical protein